MTVISDGSAQRVQLLLRTVRAVDRIVNGKLLRELQEGLLIDWPDTHRPITLTLP